MSLRELKSRLVLALGEALTDKVWSKLLESRLLDDIAALQRQIDGEASAGRGKLAEIAHKVASESDQALSLEGWHGMRLEAVLQGELLRALRRRPTSRAAIYDLYVQLTINRGYSFCMNYFFYEIQLL